MPRFHISYMSRRGIKKCRENSSTKRHMARRYRHSSWFVPMSSPSIESAKRFQGWWELGGRIFAGEPEDAAIGRITKRETGLELPTKRFTLIRQNRYFCKDRQQEPQDVGCDSLVFHYVVELSEEELQTASSNLDENEYEQVGLQEFDRQRIVSEYVSEGRLVHTR